jgi:hypothetical protein
MAKKGGGVTKKNGSRKDQKKSGSNKIWSKNNSN